MVKGNWSKHNTQIIATGCQTAKTLIATNWKEGLWLQSFPEMISMEGAASNLSEVYSKEQQLWKVKLDTIHKIHTFPRVLRRTQWSNNPFYFV